MGSGAPSRVAALKRVSTISFFLPVAILSASVFQLFPYGGLASMKSKVRVACWSEESVEPKAICSASSPSPLSIMSALAMA